MHKFLLATSAVAIGVNLFGSGSTPSNRPLPPRSRRPRPRPPTVWCSPRTPIRPSRSDKPAEQAAPAGQPKEPSKPAEASPSSCPNLPKRAEDTAVAGATARPRRRQAVSSTCRKSRIAPACWRSTRRATSRRSGPRPASPLPRAEQASRFLQGVGADGLDPADYPTPGFGNADPGQACRRRTGADQFRRHLRAPCQHRPRRVHARQRRGLLRPEGAQSGRRAGQDRRQQGCPRHARRATIRRRRNTRR